MTLAFVAIGANLGDARKAVLEAIEQLDRLPLSRTTARSSLYRSAPYEAGGPDYINAVVALETGLGPEALLAKMQQIEQQAGRERSVRNAPRTLDLDLLRHGDAVLQTERLTLPHPRMMDRAFVLLPLAEIAPGQLSAAQLARVADQVIERL